jgi:hypothetical protein
LGRVSLRFRPHRTQTRIKIKTEITIRKIADGSSLECAAGLDVLVAEVRLTSEQIRPGKERLQKIVRILIGLRKRNSTRDDERGDPAN